MKKLLTAAALMLGMSAIAQAAGDAIAPPLVLPSALQIAAQGGMKVEKSFAAEGGMTGWVLLAPGGGYAIAYTPPSGEVVVVGSMLNAKGEDLTKGYLAKYGNYDKFLPRLESAAAVPTGAKGKDVKSVVYAFMDTNCIYCHWAQQAFQPYEKAGLQVRWIPVAILGGNSAGQAAALLKAKDPTAALEQHEKTWDPRAGKPGITPLPDVPADVKKQLDDNVRLMSEMGGNGTPLILYKDSSGRLQKVSGMPRLSELPKITGLPEQPVTAPELQRFR
ncbi:Thiol:disulfide interchange protein DsbG precursor [compost metagenome]